MSDHVFIPVQPRAQRYRFWGGVLGIFGLVLAGWIMMMRTVVVEAFSQVQTEVIDTRSYLERLDHALPTPATATN